MPAARVPVRVMRIGLLLLLLAGCQDRLHPRTYPRWVVDGAGDPSVQWRDCAGLRAFVRKTGKEGMGITLEVRSKTDCEAQIARAVVVLPDGARRFTAEATIPMIPALPGRSLRYLWMPVHYDGDMMWNRGVRRGTLEIELTIAGAAQDKITWPLVELWDGPYLK